MKQILFILTFIILLSSCTVVTRSIRYQGSDIDDYKIFPKYEFKENNKKFFFKQENLSCLDSINFKNKEGVSQDLKTILSKTSTRGFIIIRNDSILFEEYFNGYCKEDISTLFSVSKSITSLLVGIAIDEGYISDVNDPVTKYIAELNYRDPMFQKLTIKHLLNMQSGIKFNESYSNPLSKMARLYYGNNQLGKIKRMRFESKPGTKHNYQSVSTAILGVVIEKATGQNLAEYFEDKVWRPLGMENTASWSLDDKKNQSAKAYSGLNMTAIDLAKIGRLYLQNGEFWNKQIVSESWIENTLTPNLSNDGYQNQWYSLSSYGVDSLGNRYFNDSISAVKVWETKYREKYPNYSVEKVIKKYYKKRYRKQLWSDPSEFKWGLKIYTGQYYAKGIMQQLMYIDPEKKIIIIRLGDNGDLNYHNLMYRITKEL